MKKYRLSDIVLNILAHFWLILGAIIVLVPLVWIGWGLGILALLALAIAGTLAVKRFR